MIDHNYESSIDLDCAAKDPDFPTGLGHINQLGARGTRVEGICNISDARRTFISEKL